MQNISSTKIFCIFHRFGENIYQNLPATSCQKVCITVWFMFIQGISLVSQINSNFTFRTLQDSLNEHKPDSDANLLATGRWQVLMNVLTKPMKNAEYFCAGNKGDDMEQFRHYALSVPLYTHFTSPIRRYPDVLVHRYCLIF